MNANATELATIAIATYFNDLKSRADLDDYIDDYESLADALDADLDDLLKNRNELDLFPDAPITDTDDSFFDRIYRTPLFDEIIDEMTRLLTLQFPAQH